MNDIDVRVSLKQFSTSDILHYEDLTDLLPRMGGWVGGISIVFSVLASFDFPER